MNKKVKIENERLLKKQQKQTERQLLLEKVNAPENDKFSDVSFDRVNEKKTILDMVDRVAPSFQRFVNNVVNQYRKKFPSEFYDELFRLKGYKKDSKKPYIRPMIFAVYTLEVVYGRFPDGIVAYFNEVNPADETGFKIFKNHQWLNELGNEKLVTIISEAIALMKECKYWDEFKRTYAIKYGMPYQIAMFEE